MATIRKHRSRWQVQVRRKDHPALSRSFGSKADALMWAREQERRIDQGNLSCPPASRQTNLSDVLTRYLQFVSPSKRSGSDAFHIRQITRHLGDLPVQVLSSAALAEFRDKRLRTVSGSTVRKELTLLASILRYARQEWGYSVPADEVWQVRKPASARGRDRRLGPDELCQLRDALSACRNPLIRQVFLFALATGMRRGEVLSLQWRNVDRQARTALLPLTKNGEARTVPLSPSAIEVLAERRADRQEASERHTRLASDLVFPISANAFRLGWERVRCRAGVEDLRFHDLRHEAISRFFEMGLSVPEVALISGHKDARMLFRYTHLRAEEVAKKLL